MALIAYCCQVSIDTRSTCCTSYRSPSTHQILLPSPHPSVDATWYPQPLTRNRKFSLHSQNSPHNVRLHIQLVHLQS